LAAIDAKRAGKVNYRLDSGDERLWNGDQPIQISNRAFQLLHLFVRNPNRLLTKDDILDAVWGDLCVTEGLVKEYVHDLRAALDDDPKIPRFIETVRGRGYRFLGGVEEFKRAPAEPGIHGPSLVVLPIKNLTDDRRWQRFCSGLSDDLVTDLARYPDFRVIAHNGSTIHFPDELNAINFRRNLGPQYVLSGSVQASETQVRVNVRLVQTGSDNHLWAERFDRELGEVFNIQSEIVNQVASAIGGFHGQIPHAERLRLGRKPPEDLQAYELYLLAHELEARFEKQSTTKALELAQRAVQLDPAYARAWLVVGWTCWQLSLEKNADDPTDYSEQAREAFRRAAALDPLDPYAIMELAAVRAGDGDTNGARNAMERTLDLGRNQPELHVVASNTLAIVLDEPVRAIELLDQGLQQIAVPSDWHQITMARVAYFTEDFARALEDTRHAPTNLLTRLIEILALAQLDRADEIHNLVQTLITKHPDFDPQEFVNSYPMGVGARHLFINGIEKAGLSK
jgi:TolB-like protein